MPGARRGHRGQGSARCPHASAACAPEPTRGARGYDSRMSGPSAADPGASLDPARRAAGRSRCSRSSSRSTLGHVLFLFLTASVIAFTLNPLVRDLTRTAAAARARGGVVYSLFAAAAIAVFVPSAASWSIRAHRRGPGRHLPHRRARSAGTHGAEQDIDRLQALARRPRARGHQDPEAARTSSSTDLGAGEISGTSRTRSRFAQGAAFSRLVLLFAIILIVVISIYMLLDMPRLE